MKKSAYARNFWHKHQGWSLSFRVIALSIALVFTTTSVTWGETLPSPVSNISFSNRFIEADTLQVPKSLGNIDFVGISPKQEAPLIVMVQDAHAVTAAQEKISQILHYLQETYQIALVGVEGGEGLLDPTLISSFPEENRKREFVQASLRSGALTGVESALILKPEQALYSGIEDWDLYEDNYFAYLRAYQNKDTVQGFLKTLKDQFDKKRKAVFNEKLNQSFISIQGFRSGEIHLIDLLQAVMPPSSEARKAARDLFPKLAAVLASLEGDSGNGETLRQDLEVMASRFEKQFLRQMSREEQQKFNHHFQGFRTEHLGAGEFLSYLVQTGELYGALPRLTPEMTKVLSAHKTVSDLQGTVLFDELNSFFNWLQFQIAETEEEKSLLAQYENLNILENLTKLKLTRSQLDQYLSQVGELQKMMSNYREAFRPFLEFYELALARDRVFAEKMETLLERYQTRNAIFVGGGFHTQGLARELKEKGFSFVVITPAVTELEGFEKYEKLMLGDLPYRKDLEKEGFYPAFMNFSALELTRPYEGRLFRNYLKTWRDEIIRRLAQQKRLHQTRDYTQYVDRLYEVYQDKLDGVQDAESRISKTSEIEAELSRFAQEHFGQYWEQAKASLDLFAEKLKSLTSKQDKSRETAISLINHILSARTASLKYAGPASSLIPKGPDDWRLRRILAKGLGVLDEVAPSVRPGPGDDLPFATVDRYVDALGDVAVTGNLKGHPAIRAEARNMLRTGQAAALSELGESAISTDDLAKPIARVREAIGEEQVASGVIAEALRSEIRRQQGQKVTPNTVESRLSRLEETVRELKARMTNEVSSPRSELRLRPKPAVGVVSDPLDSKNEGELRQKEQLAQMDFSSRNQEDAFYFTLADLDHIHKINDFLSKNLVGTLGQSASPDVLLSEESLYRTVREVLVQLATERGINIHRYVGGDEFVPELTGDTQTAQQHLNELVREFSHVFRSRYEVYRIQAEEDFLEPGIVQRAVSDLHERGVMAAVIYGSGYNILIDQDKAQDPNILMRELLNDLKWSSNTKLKTDRLDPYLTDFDPQNPRGLFTFSAGAISAGQVFDFLTRVMGEDYWVETRQGRKMLRRDRIEAFHRWGMRMANDMLTHAKQSGRNRAYFFQGTLANQHLSKPITREKILEEEQKQPGSVQEVSSAAASGENIIQRMLTSTEFREQSRQRNMKTYVRVVVLDYGLGSDRAFHTLQEQIGYQGGNQVIEAVAEMLPELITGDPRLEGLMISRNPPDVFDLALSKDQDIRGPPLWGDNPIEAAIEQLTEKVRFIMNKLNLPRSLPIKPRLAIFRVSKSEMEKLSPEMKIQVNNMFEAMDMVVLANWWNEMMSEMEFDVVEQDVVTRAGVSDRYSIINFDAETAEQLLVAYRQAQDWRARHALKELKQSRSEMRDSKKSKDQPAISETQKEDENRFDAVQIVIDETMANAIHSAASIALQHERGTALFTAWEDDEAIRILIEDSGPGFDPRQLREIAIGIRQRLNQQHGTQDYVRENEKTLREEWGDAWFDALLTLSESDPANPVAWMPAYHDFLFSIPMGEVAITGKKEKADSVPDEGKIAVEGELYQRPLYAIMGLEYAYLLASGRGQGLVRAFVEDENKLGGTLTTETQPESGMGFRLYITLPHSKLGEGEDQALKQAILKWSQEYEASNQKLVEEKGYFVDVIYHTMFESHEAQRAMDQFVIQEVGELSLEGLLEKTIIQWDFARESDDETIQQLLGVSNRLFGLLKEDKVSKMALRAARVEGILAVLKTRMELSGREEVLLESVYRPWYEIAKQDLKVLEVRQDFFPEGQSYQALMEDWKAFNLPIQHSRSELRTPDRDRIDALVSRMQSYIKRTDLEEPRLGIYLMQLELLHELDILNKDTRVFNLATGANLLPLHFASEMHTVDYRLTEEGMRERYQNLAQDPNVRDIISKWQSQGFVIEGKPLHHDSESDVVHDTEFWRNWTGQMRPGDVMLFSYAMEYLHGFQGSEQQWSWVMGVLSMIPEGVTVVIFENTRGSFEGGLLNYFVNQADGYQDLILPELNEEQRKRLEHVYEQMNTLLWQNGKSVRDIPAPHSDKVVNFHLGGRMTAAEKLIPASELLNLIAPQSRRSELRRPVISAPWSYAQGLAHELIRREITVTEWDYFVSLFADDSVDASRKGRMQEIDRILGEVADRVGYYPHNDELVNAVSQKIAGPLHFHEMFQQLLKENRIGDEALWWYARFGHRIGWRKDSLSPKVTDSVKQIRPLMEEAIEKSGYHPGDSYFQLLVTNLGSPIERQILSLSRKNMPAPIFDKPKQKPKQKREGWSLYSLAVISSSAFISLGIATAMAMGYLTPLQTVLILAAAQGLFYVALRGIEWLVWLFTDDLASAFMDQFRQTNLRLYGLALLPKVMAMLIVFWMSDARANWVSTSLSESVNHANVPLVLPTVEDSANSVKWQAMPPSPISMPKPTVDRLSLTEEQMNEITHRSIDLEAPLTTRITQLKTLVRNMLQLMYPNASEEELYWAEKYWSRVAFVESDSLKTRLQYSVGGPGTGLWQVETGRWRRNDSTIGSFTGERMLWQVLNESKSRYRKFLPIAIRIFGSEEQIGYFAWNANRRHRKRASPEDQKHSEDLRDFIVNHDAAGFFLAVLRLESSGVSISDIPRDEEGLRELWIRKHWAGADSKRPAKRKLFSAKVESSPIPLMVLETQPAEGESEEAARRFWDEKMSNWLSRSEMRTKKEASLSLWKRWGLRREIHKMLRDYERAASIDQYEKIVNWLLENPFRVTAVREVQLYEGLTSTLIETDLGITLEMSESGTIWIMGKVRTSLMSLEPVEKEYGLDKPLNEYFLDGPYANSRAVAFNQANHHAENLAKKILLVQIQFYNPSLQETMEHTYDGLSSFLPGSRKVTVVRDLATAARNAPRAVHDRITEGNLLVPAAQILVDIKNPHGSMVSYIGRVLNRDFDSGTLQFLLSKPVLNAASERYHGDAAIDGYLDRVERAPHSFARHALIYQENPSLDRLTPDDYSLLDLLEAPVRRFVESNAVLTAYYLWAMRAGGSASRNAAQEILSDLSQGEFGEIFSHPAYNAVDETGVTADTQTWEAFERSLEILKNTPKEARKIFLHPVLLKTLPYFKGPKYIHFLTFLFAQMENDDRLVDRALDLVWEQPDEIKVGYLWALANGGEHRERMVRGGIKRFFEYWGEETLKVAFADGRFAANYSWVLDQFKYGSEVFLIDGEWGFFRPDSSEEFPERERRVYNGAKNIFDSIRSEPYGLEVYRVFVYWINLLKHDLGEKETKYFDAFKKYLDAVWHLAQRGAGPETMRSYMAPLNSKARGVDAYDDIFSGKAFIQFWTNEDFLDKLLELDDQSAAAVLDAAANIVSNESRLSEEAKEKHLQEFYRYFLKFLPEIKKIEDKEESFRFTDILMQSTASSYLSQNLEKIPEALSLLRQVISVRPNGTAVAINIFGWLTNLSFQLQAAERSQELNEEPDKEPAPSRRANDEIAVMQQLINRLENLNELRDFMAAEGTERLLGRMPGHIDQIADLYQQSKENPALSPSEPLVWAHRQISLGVDPFAEIASIRSRLLNNEWRVRFHAVQGRVDPFDWVSRLREEKFDDPVATIEQLVQQLPDIHIGSVLTTLSVLNQKRNEALRGVRRGPSIDIEVFIGYATDFGLYENIQLYEIYRTMRDTAQRLGQLPVIDQAVRTIELLQQEGMSQTGLFCSQLLMVEKTSVLQQLDLGAHAQPIHEEALMHLIPYLISPHEEVRIRAFGSFEFLEKRLNPETKPRLYQRLLSTMGEQLREYDAKERREGRKGIDFVAGKLELLTDKETFRELVEPVYSALLESYLLGTSEEDVTGFRETLAAFSGFFGEPVAAQKVRDLIRKNRSLMIDRWTESGSGPLPGLAAFQQFMAAIEPFAFDEDLKTHPLWPYLMPGEAFILGLQIQQNRVPFNKRTGEDHRRWVDQMVAMRLWSGEDRDTFVEFANRFGYPTAFQYISNRGPRHDIIMTMPDVMHFHEKLKGKENKEKRNRFIDNVMAQVSRDNGVDSQGYNSYQRLVQHINNYDPDWVQILRQTDVPHPKYQRIRRRLLKNPDLPFSSFKEFENLGFVMLFLKRKEIIEILDGWKQEARTAPDAHSRYYAQRRYDYLMEIIFNDNVRDFNAVREFVQNIDAFWRSTDSGGSEIVHDALKPSNYVDGTDYVDLTSEELRDGILTGRLDNAMAFRPMEMEFYTHLDTWGMEPLSKKFARVWQSQVYRSGYFDDEALAHYMNGLGFQVTAETAAETAARLLPDHYQKLNVRWVLRQGVPLRPAYAVYQEALPQGILPFPIRVQFRQYLIDTYEQSQSKIEYAAQQKQSGKKLTSEERAELQEAQKFVQNVDNALQHQGLGDKFKAKIYPKSDPRSIITGDEAPCCAAFGTGKNNQYITNLNTAHFVITTEAADALGEPYDRTIINSVMTLDRDIGLPFTEFFERVTQSENVRKLNYYRMLEGSQFEETAGGAVHIAADNIEGAQNFIDRMRAGKEMGGHVTWEQFVEVMYRDFFTAYVMQHPQSKAYEPVEGRGPPLDPSRILVGPAYNDYLKHLSQNATDNTYSPQSLIAYSDNNQAETWTLPLETLPQPKAVEPSSLRPLNYENTLEVAYLEGKVFREVAPEWVEGLATIQNHLMKVSLNEAIKGAKRKNFSVGYYQEGQLVGYLIAYVGFDPQSKQEVVYAADLAVDPEMRQKNVAGLLVRHFLSQVRDGYTHLPIIGEMRNGEFGSYDLITRRAERNGLKIEEDMDLGDGRHRVILRFKGAEGTPAPQVQNGFRLLSVEEEIDAGIAQQIERRLNLPAGEVSKILSLSQARIMVSLNDGIVDGVIVGQRADQVQNNFWLMEYELENHQDIFFVTHLYGMSDELSLDLMTAFYERIRGDIQTPYAAIVLEGALKEIIEQSVFETQSEYPEFEVHVRPRHDSDQKYFRVRMDQIGLLQTEEAISGTTIGYSGKPTAPALPAGGRSEIRSARWLSTVPSLGQGVPKSELRIPVEKENKTFAAGETDVVSIEVDPREWNIHVTVQEELHDRVGIDRNTEARFFIDDQGGKVINPNIVEIVDADAKTLERFKQKHKGESVIVAVDNSSLFFNQGFVTYVNGRIYHTEGENVEAHPYSSLIIKKSGEIRMQEVNYHVIEDNRASILEDENNEIAYATFGQFLLDNNGSPRSYFESIIPQFQDLRHVFQLPKIQVAELNHPLEQQIAAKELYFDVSQLSVNDYALAKKAWKQPVSLDLSMQVALQTDDGAKKEPIDIPINVLRQSLSANGYQEVSRGSIRERGQFAIEGGQIEIFFTPGIYPRTMVGIKRNGNLGILGVKGQSGRVGVTLEESARLAQEKGFVQVMLLDHGGSAKIFANGEYVLPSSQKRYFRTSALLVTTKKSMRSEVHSAQWLSTVPSLGQGVPKSELRERERKRLVEIINKGSNADDAEYVKSVRQRLEAPQKLGTNWLRVTASSKEAYDFYHAWERQTTETIEVVIAGQTFVFDVDAIRKTQAWFGGNPQYERLGYFVAEKDAGSIRITNFIPVASVAVDPSLGIKYRVAEMEQKRITQSASPMFLPVVVRPKALQILGFYDPSFELPIKNELVFPTHSHYLQSLHQGPSPQDFEVNQGDIQFVYALKTQSLWGYARRNEQSLSTQILVEGEVSKSELREKIVNEEGYTIETFLLPAGFTSFEPLSIYETRILYAIGSEDTKVFFSQPDRTILIEEDIKNFFSHFEELLTVDKIISIFDGLRDQTLFQMWKDLQQSSQWDELEDIDQRALRRGFEAYIQAFYLLQNKMMYELGFEPLVDLEKIEPSDRLNGGDAYHYRFQRKGLHRIFMGPEGLSSDQSMIFTIVDNHLSGVRRNGDIWASSAFLEPGGGSIYMSKAPGNSPESTVKTAISLSQGEAPETVLNYTDEHLVFESISPERQIFVAHIVEPRKTFRSEMREINLQSLTAVLKVQLDARFETEGVPLQAHIFAYDSLVGSGIKPEEVNWEDGFRMEFTLDGEVLKHEGDVVYVSFKKSDLPRQPMKDISMIEMEGFHTVMVFDFSQKLFETLTQHIQEVSNYGLVVLEYDPEDKKRYLDLFQNYWRKERKDQKAIEIIYYDPVKGEAISPRHVDDYLGHHNGLMIGLVFKSLQREAPSQVPIDDGDEYDERVALLRRPLTPHQDQDDTKPIDEKTPKPRSEKPGISRSELRVDPVSFVPQTKFPEKPAPKPLVTAPESVESDPGNQDVARKPPQVVFDLKRGKKEAEEDETDSVHRPADQVILDKTPVKKAGYGDRPEIRQQALKQQADALTEKLKQEDEERAEDVHRSELRSAPWLSTAPSLGEGMPRSELHQPDSFGPRFDVNLMRILQGSLQSLKQNLLAIETQNLSDTDEQTQINQMIDAWHNKAGQILDEAIDSQRRRLNLIDFTSLAQDLANGEDVSTAVEKTFADFAWMSVSQKSALTSRLYGILANAFESSTEQIALEAFGLESWFIDLMNNRLNQLPEPGVDALNLTVHLPQSAVLLEDMGRGLRASAGDFSSLTFLYNPDQVKLRREFFSGLQFTTQTYREMSRLADAIGTLRSKARNYGVKPVFAFDEAHFETMGLHLGLDAIVTGVKEVPEGQRELKVLLMRVAIKILRFLQAEQVRQSQNPAALLKQYFNDLSFMVDYFNINGRNTPQANITGLITALKGYQETLRSA